MTFHLRVSISVVFTMLGADTERKRGMAEKKYAQLPYWPKGLKAENPLYGKKMGYMLALLRYSGLFAFLPLCQEDSWA